MQTSFTHWLSQATTNWESSDGWNDAGKGPEMSSCADVFKSHKKLYCALRKLEYSKKNNLTLNQNKHQTLSVSASHNREPKTTQKLKQQTSLGIRTQPATSSSRI